MPSKTQPIPDNSSSSSAAPSRGESASPSAFPGANPASPLIKGLTPLPMAAPQLGPVPGGPVPGMESPTTAPASAGRAPSAITTTIISSDPSSPAAPGSGSSGTASSPRADGKRKSNGKG